MMQNINENIEFGYYLTAFVDLLGQSEALKSIDRLPNSNDDFEMKQFIVKVKDTFGLIHGFHSSFNNFFVGYSQRQGAPQLNAEQRKIYGQMNSNEIKLQRFSDGMLLYLSLRDNMNQGHIRGVAGIIFSCGAMFLLWLSKGYVMRAGVDIGIAAELYENELYGPAPAKAYHLENNSCQYPRIVIGEGLIKYINTIKESEDNDFSKVNKILIENAEQMIAYDDDGLPIVDYLGKEFQTRFKSLNMGDIAFDGYNFIVKQSERWQKERDSKLAFRYSLLRNYFDARLPNWKK
jgi:hypothetical protein